MESKAEFQVVIMADAGHMDNLLHPLTEVEPVCLLPVANRPLLSFQLEILERSGFDSALVVICEKNKAAVEKFINHYKVNLKIRPVVVVVGNEDDTADALRHLKIKGYLEKDFFVMTGDIITNMFLNSLADIHRSQNASLTCLFKRTTRKPSDKRKKSRISDDIDLHFVGIDESSSRLILYRSAIQVEDEIRVHKSILQKHPKMKIHTQLKDAHLYLFSHWVLDLLLVKKHITSIQEELIPYLVWKQFVKQRQPTPTAAPTAGPITTPVTPATPTKSPTLTTSTPSTTSATEASSETASETALETAPNKTTVGPTPYTVTFEMRLNNVTLNVMEDARDQFQDILALSLGKVFVNRAQIKLAIKDDGIIGINVEIFNISEEQQTYIVQKFRKHGAFVNLFQELQTKKHEFATSSIISTSGPIAEGGLNMPLIPEPTPQQVWARSMSHVPQQSDDPIKCYTFIPSNDQAFCFRCKTPDNYFQLNRDLAFGRELRYTPWRSLSEDNTIRMTQSQNPNAVIGDACVIGQKLSIGDGSQIKKSVIGNHCRIGNNVKITNSILMDEVVIEDGSVISNTIFSTNSTISKGSKIANCKVGANYVSAPNADNKNDILVLERADDDADAGTFHFG